MSVTDEIKARLDIVDFIDQYAPLKKSGRNYKALCPFHSEKTPSFVVFPDSQQWRCFGACSEGGDIFSFVMKLEGWEFPEALRFLADKAGVELQPTTPAQQEARDARERLLNLLDEAAHFYHRLLYNAAQAEFARQYVAERGMTAETVDQWLIGYAPDSWDATMNFLLEQGYERDDLVAAGMLVVRDDGSIYDRFRDRLMIPIRDSRGNVTGFGARALAPDAVPKYLNSPQTDVFDKSSTLFGFSQARRTIRETESAVIVEGYMDVLQAHQAGFTNVVAEMGTALTEPQLRLLSRYASRLILALDPDVAGQMATDRGREVIERVSRAAAEQAADEGVWDFDAAERDYRAKLTTEFDARGMIRYESRMGFDIRVIVLPEKMDPDDLIREDPDWWVELVESATPIVEYVIQRTSEGADLDDPKVKSRIAAEIIPLIEDIANPIERSHYMQRLSRLLRVPEDTLFPDRGKSGVPGRPQRQPPAPRDEPPGDLPAGAARLLDAPTRSREAFCLAALIKYPRLIYRVNRVLAEFLAPEQLAGTLPDELAPDAEPTEDLLSWRIIPADFAVPEHQDIFRSWVAALDQEEMAPVAWLMERIDPVSREVLDGWLSRPLYALLRSVVAPEQDLSYDMVFEETVRGVLALRSRRLEEDFRSLVYMLEEDADTGILTAHSYGDTINALRTARVRVDRAIARYSETGKRQAADEEHRKQMSGR